MSLKEREISEREYLFALQVSEMSLYSKDLKGIADMMGKTPQEARDYYTDIVKAYNQRRYSPKLVQPAEKKAPAGYVSSEKRERKTNDTPAWEGKTGIFIPKSVLISIFTLIIMAVFLFLTFKPDNKATISKEKPSDKSESEHFDIKKTDGDYVASVNSDVYHKKSCDYAEKIKNENRIYFETTGEARGSGRRPCEVCFFSNYHFQVPVSNGEIITYPYEECIAPLTIETRGELNYYVVLDGSDQMSFYVKAGKTAEVEVPLGDYKISYAVGKTWYGKDYKFGPETQYYKCDGYFDFYEEDGYVNGWTLELYLQNNGNLHTDEVDAADFPNI